MGMCDKKKNNCIFVEGGFGTLHCSISMKDCPHPKPTSKTDPYSSSFDAFIKRLG